MAIIMKKNYLLVLKHDLKNIHYCISKTVDLHLLWSFLDIILFKTVKYYQMDDVNRSNPIGLLMHNLLLLLFEMMKQKIIIDKNMN